MGFYGNITNSSRTQFSFDRTYQNRAYMERAMYTDGVYVGRYVLIDYDSGSINANEYKRVYRADDYLDNRYLYMAADCSAATRIAFSSAGTEYDEWGQPILTNGVSNGTIVYVLEDNQFTTFYEVSGLNGDYAAFYPISTSSSYTFNYLVDKTWAQERGYPEIGRGWDSTVWQKVYLNGVEKYVMIAELNSVVPTFAISSDAPTLTPIAPHFGANSTNMYYNLHWQPSWGFRLRSADATLLTPGVDENGNELENESILASSQTIITPSDYDVEWSKVEYDKTTDTVTNYKFNILTNSWLSAATITMDDEEAGAFKIPASIYFNKAGFSSTDIAYSSDITDASNLFWYDEDIKRSKWLANENKISLEPTGFSGHQYHNHENNLLTTYEADTLELSIMLPVLGNTVAAMWDLIYGGRENSLEIKETNKRNKDIGWEDASRGGEKKGLRLIQKEDGKYTYNVSLIDTLAGCINSAHDLMGMIITNEVLSDDDIQSADERWIYYNRADGTYNRKHKIYTYPLDGTLQDYKEIELTGFDPSLNYFEKRNNNYLALTEPREHVDYYLVTDEGEYGYFVDTYTPNKYYYTEPLDDTLTTFRYVVDTNPEPTGNRDYTALYEYNTEEGYVILGPILHLYFFYSDQGYFYYLPDDVGPDFDITSFRPAGETTMVPGRRYYYQTITYTPSSLFIQYIPISPGMIVDFEPNTYYTYEDGVYTPITVKPITRDATMVVTCYELPYKRSSIFFYEPGKYYYKNEGNFLLDLSTEFVEDRLYYTPIFTRVEDVTFYMPNKYYYLNNGEYIKDETNEITNDRTYYERLLKYVAEDRSGAFPVGSIWNENIDNVPSTVTLCNREESWEMQVLPGFSDHVNTLFGLLLLINNILETGDIYTRDRNTVQGSINILHDIIAKFEILNPTDIMITDDHGRIRGSVLTSALSYGYTNVGTNTTVAPGAAAEDLWIYWNVDANVLNPLITIGHRAHTVADTTTIADKNTALGTGLNVGIGDTIDLYTPIVDNMGHIVGKNTETITLPYGFKTIKVTNSIAVTDAADTILAAGQIADNTQDILTFASTNKWIKLDNNTEDTIKIGHVVSTIDTVANATTNLNLETGANDEENIDIPDFTYDEAGHITSKKSHTYTLPFGFKILKSLAQSEDDNAWTSAAGAETQIVADSTLDTLSLATGNKWVRVIPDASLDKITFAHETHTITTTDLTAIDINAAGQGDTFDTYRSTYDIAGHFTGYQKLTYTLPYSFKTFSIDVQSTALTLMAVNTNSIVADNSKDLFTFATGNKWIRLAIDADNDKLTLAHSVEAIATSTTTSTLSSTSQGATFDVPTYAYDEAGHITSVAAITYTIPNSFGIIQADNSSTAEADVTHDTLSFTGDTWVSVVASNNSNAANLAVTHKTPAITEHTTSAVTPTFGGTFTVDDWYFDSCGHNNGYTSHTVTIPSITVSNKVISATEIIKTNANVLTDISFNNNTGVFELERTNVGNLLLTGYTKNYINNNETVVYTGEVNASDSINIALAKLSNDIYGLNALLNTADSGIIAQIENLDNLLNDTDGIVDLISDINNTINILEDSDSSLSYSDNITYLLTRTATGIEWIAMETWTGGSY